MLVCSECQQVREADTCIVWEGQVLCAKCSLELIITKLNTINTRLKYILDLLERVEAYEHRAEEES